MFLQLLTNTADQVIRLTLDEGRQYYSEAFTDYLLILTREENSNSGLDLAQVPVITADNQRITTLTITTVPLITPGRYRYDVYGQNSDSNLDPENAVVVGLLEQGWGTLATDYQPFEPNDGIIPDDKRNG